MIHNCWSMKGASEHSNQSWREEGKGKKITAPTFLENKTERLSAFNVTQNVLLMRMDYELENVTVALQNKFHPLSVNKKKWKNIWNEKCTVKTVNDVSEKALVVSSCDIFTTQRQAGPADDGQFKKGQNCSELPD